MGFRASLTLLVLATSCLVINANILDHLTWTQAPHHAPSYPPTQAPAPHKGGHHKGGGHHHHKAPTVSPVHPPVKAPVHPPVKAPVKAPVHPPVKAPAPRAPVVRKQVAVRGMVYCKACKYRGIDTLTSATPLQGAV
nr:hypothetical protein [Tanacetum cinerariifolium]